MLGFFAVLGAAAAVVVAGATGALGLGTRAALGARALVLLGLVLRLRPPAAFVRARACAWAAACVAKAAHVWSMISFNSAS